MSDLNGILLAQLERVRARRGRGPFVIETGAIRSDAPEHAADDGWSTFTFARYVAEHGGGVRSIDLNVSAARRVLDRHDLGGVVELIEGYSVEVMVNLLASGARADLILLDSANDAQLILHEFFVARRLLVQPGIILIDDAEPGSDSAIKGREVLRWLGARGWSFEVLRREGTTYSTDVLVISEGL